ncbi:hypothetical protein AAMO2058_001360900 [Amorphochlora amoebiformis]
MGSTSSSRFRSAVSTGDEKKAIEVYISDSTFARSLHLSKVPEKEKYRKNTTLHHICRWALADLLELVLPPVGRETKTQGLNSLKDFKTIKVTVPKGKTPGESFFHILPEGNKMKVTVPHGATEGTKLKVSFYSPATCPIHPTTVKNAADKCALEILLNYSDNASKRHRILLHIWSHIQYAKIDFTIDQRFEGRQTLLHMAAGSNLTECAFFLVDRGAALDAEDSKGLNPAAMAESKGHHMLAARLEATMVFHPLYIQEAKAMEVKLKQLVRAIDISHIGYRDSKALDSYILSELHTFMQAIKFQDEFAAECLLSAYNWNIQMATSLWKRNKKEAATRSGIHPSGYVKFIPPPPPPPIKNLPLPPPPLSASCKGEIIRKFRALNHPTPNIFRALQTATSIIARRSSAVNREGKEEKKDQESKGEEEKDQESKRSWVALSQCHHVACTTCWKRIVEIGIQKDGRSCAICPGVNCENRVGGTKIEHFLGLGEDMKHIHLRARALRDTVIRSRRELKWCPYPDCGGAVRRLRRGRYVGKIADCGAGHAFCFECGAPPHDPATCTQAGQWKMASLALKKEMGYSDKEDNDATKTDLATMIWLSKNTKPCPKCKTKIQKNEGCNHMTCEKCRYQFCWICMGDWEPHGKEYYFCNKYEGKGPAQNKEENKRIKESIKQTERLTYFLGRFQAHYESSFLEQKMLQTAEKRMADLQNSTLDNVRTDFVETAFRELFLNRVALCGAYIYRFYAQEKKLKPSRASDIFSYGIEMGLSLVDMSKLQRFDRQHAMLERNTERLSSAVARKRWSATCAKIMTLTFEAVQAREDLFKIVEDIKSTPLESKQYKDRPPSPSSESHTTGGNWACTQCTFSNREAASKCAMCGLARPSNARCTIS